MMKMPRYLSYEEGKTETPGLNSVRAEGEGGVTQDMG